MNCPNCKKSMEIVRKDESNNFKDGTVYARTVCECKHCGTWVTTEIPKESK